MTAGVEEQDEAEVWPPEDFPDGTFGHSRSRLPDHIKPCTPEEQARHHADLSEALSGLALGDIIRRHTRPGDRP